MVRKAPIYSVHSKGKKESNLSLINKFEQSIFEVSIISRSLNHKIYGHIIQKKKLMIHNFFCWGALFYRTSDPLTRRKKNPVRYYFVILSKLFACLSCMNSKGILMNKLILNRGYHDKRASVCGKKERTFYSSRKYLKIRIQPISHKNCIKSILLLF